MHFDTFEAFSKAVYKRVGFVPCDLHDAFEHINRRALRGGQRDLVKDLSDATSSATGMLCRLTEAAFYVHEVSTSHKAPGDDLLGYRIEEAREKLIPGWQIVIQVAAGRTYVMLVDPQDNQVEFPSRRETLSEQVTDALLYAERPEEKRRKPVLYTEDPDHGD
jgi:AraC-like DNA-binding protein